MWTQFIEHKRKTFLVSLVPRLQYHEMLKVGASGAPFFLVVFVRDSQTWRTDLRVHVGPAAPWERVKGLQLVPRPTTATARASSRKMRSARILSLSL
jgi:hypothetical protein